MDTSEKNQWRLVELRYGRDHEGTLSQFLLNNNFPNDSDIPDVGKYKTAFRNKLDGVKNLPEYQRNFIIQEGQKSGKNLLLKKYRHLIPEASLQTDTSRQTDTVVRSKNHLDIIAKMSVQEKTAFFCIMKDMPDNLLPELIRLLIACQ